MEAGREDRVRAWVVYPERPDPAPVVVVVHETYGLTDWIRSVADQMAAEGFIAIAPDLLSGKGPDDGGSESVDRQGAVRLIRAPVLGLYGGDDARVNATIPEARTRMETLGKAYEVNIYQGAGHGFLRQQDGRDGANREAALVAWPRTATFFREHLGV